MKQFGHLLVGLLSISGGVVLGFAPAPLPRTINKVPDLKLLQGVWTPVEDRTNGDLTTPFGLSMTISEKQLQFYVNGKKADGWEITLDPNAKPPLLEMKNLDDKRILYARYRIDNGTIMLGLNTDGSRPADFSERTHRVILFRR